ncbi:unnamed protein product [Parnassius apollo]|uniref:(apollo) hypothetical protein n=1 Tax=Parnassius apollo TaxID=110799 RepID=A0A8S3Y4R0_PARAO|nr:unnamed protein product [Parnassius apollo]
MEKAVDSLADLSDLSEYDSEDYPFYADSIHTLSDSYLNQPDDCIIEQRLEKLFSIEDNLNVDTLGNEAEEVDEPTTQASKSLLSILSKPPSKEIVGTAMAINLVSEQNISNNQIQVQESCTQEKGSDLFAMESLVEDQREYQESIYIFHFMSKMIEKT